MENLPRFTPRVLGDLLDHHDQSRREAPAVQFDGRWYDYGKLFRRSERAAARLWHEWGVRAGDRVAYLGLNQLDQLTLLFALGRIGAVLVPLNFRLAPAEWQAVLTDCAPCGLLHDAAWQDAAQALARQAGLPAHGLNALIATHAPGDAPRFATPDSPALLVYTSGTTGLPKGAVHTHANLLANMAAAVAGQGLTPADRVLTVLPLFHVGGLCIQTLPALYAGAAVLLHARFDPAATLAAIAGERPSLTLQVPATMKALIGHPGWAGTDLASLRAVWAGSSTLPDALVQAFLARGVPLCNVYGATETGPFSIALSPGQARSHAGSCGWPAPGVEVRLAQPHAGVGEVWLRAPAIVQRYWPDRPACDADGWFHTGDLASRAADGSFTIAGRAKDMIISGGENIYPAEIEHLLATHPLVAECAVLGLPDPQWGEVVAAVVVGSNPAPPAGWEDELNRFLEGRIARYKLPRRWQAAQTLPRTALGKVQKAQLARLFEP
jgi:fatty-acyl-CoA synthase